MKCVSAFAAAALLATTALVWPQGAAAAPPSSQELVQPPRLGQVAISPSGRYLAMVRRKGLSDSVAVLDLQTRTQQVVFSIPQTEGLDISGMFWKGDERIVVFWRGYTVRTNADGEARTKTRRGETYADVDRYARGITAVDRATGESRSLGRGRLADRFLTDPGHILLTEVEGFTSEMVRSRTPRATLYSVDLKTGDRKVVETGSPNTLDWDLDAAGQVAIRYDTYGRRGGVRVMGRDAKGVWTEAFSIAPKDIEALPDVGILAPTGERGKFYVAVKPKEGGGARTLELRVYDFINRTMGEKLWSHPQYDFDSVVVEGPEHRLTGICYWGEVYRCDNLDVREARQTKALSDFFTAERSVAVNSSSDDGQLRVLGVSGPDEPSSFYLFDRKTQKVTLIGSGHPELPPSRLGLVKPHSWTASDGKVLGGYLTTPAGSSGKLPLVVMPHGGPEVRDYLAYDPWAQAFATRGYAVFQPNFRGSGGFGATFGEEGHGQWGLRMQDDVIDGVKDLIARGVVDPERICILGASYGGYVALQAGAKNPELFKCVVSQAGVSDLAAMMKWEKVYFDETSPRYKYWLKSMGDPATDADRMKAVSPVTYAATYGPPVLLLHGDEDWTVPLDQSEIMEKALKRAGRSVELVVYPFEDHSGWETRHAVNGLDRMIAFVDKAIGAKPQ